MSLLGHSPVRTRGAWTVWVVGRPVGGRALLADAFLEQGPIALDGWGGDWSVVARRSGEERLFVATDPFGGVPMFVSGGTASLEVVWTGALDRVEFRQHLDARFDEPWRTWFEGVWRIPAGRQGWLGHPRDLRPVFHPRGSTQPLREAIRASVLHRATDEPWVALSGGLDSSVVAIELAEQGSVRAISNRFDGWSCDEGPYMDALCGTLNLKRDDVDSRELPDVLEHFAPPHFPPVGVNHHLNLALMAPGRVLYTGFGGDEVVGHGFDVVRELVADHRVVAAMREGVLLGLRYRHAEAGTGEEVGRWMREVVGALRQPPTPAELRQRRIARWSHPLLSRSREEQLHLARLSGTRLEMPMLDVGIVRSVVEQPASWRARRGVTRWPLRQAYRASLPATIAGRTNKADLSRSVRLTPVLERYGELLDATDLTSQLSDHQRDRLKEALQVSDGSMSDVVWRAVGAARFLTWHSGA